MREKKEVKPSSRREFFKKVGLGAGAVAVATTATSAKAETDSARGSRKTGYRETDHVKKYYSLAKF